MIKYKDIKYCKQWMQMIHDIAYDRDGYTSAEDLGKLIDEIYTYSTNALENKPCKIVKEIV